MDGDEKITEVCLRTSDKQVAEQRLRALVREKQQEREGIILPERLRQGSSRPLSEHLADFIREKSTVGCGKKRLKTLGQQLGKLFADCRWNLLRDVSAASFQDWRSQQSYSPKTLNHYLSTASTFLNWMVETERAGSNPLLRVKPVETRGRETRIRRSLRIEELQQLISVSEDRGIIYALAAYSGLRRGELAQIEWRDCHLDRTPGVLQARVATTKNKEQATIPLHPCLADMLRFIRPVDARPSDRVFSRIPRMNVYRQDLKNAGIVYKDELGRVFDFHALRKTWGTHLTLNGAQERVVMELMRHSDMKLTAKVYTDEALLPLNEAVLRLPALHFPQIAPQIAPQNAVPERLSVSQAVRISKNAVQLQASDSEQLDSHNPILSLAVQLVKMVRDAGFEPATSCV